MDNFSIQSHLRSLSGLGQLGQSREITPLAAPGAGAAESAGPSFQDTLTSSISQVNGLMNESDRSIEDLATGKSGNVHDTLIALQKADISFKMMLEVRTKVMNAYNEIMRMQV